MNEVIDLTDSVTDTDVMQTEGPTDDTDDTDALDDQVEADG